MAFYKIENNGYVLGVAQSSGEGNISETEYNELSEMIRKKPSAPEGFDYRLTNSLEWELHELSIETDESIEGEDMTETEMKAVAYDILVGDAK